LIEYLVSKLINSQEVIYRHRERSVAISNPLILLGDRSLTLTCHVVSLLAITKSLLPFLRIHQNWPKEAKFFHELIT